MKVLIGDTIWSAIFSGHPSHVKVYPFAGQSEYLHFSVVLRPKVYGPAPGFKTPQPSALQSSALPTELILPQSELNEVNDMTVAVPLKI